MLRAAISLWRGQGWLQADPTAGLERRPAPPDRTRSLTRDQISALFALDVGLREKTYWRLLYETAARAEEILATSRISTYRTSALGWCLLEYVRVR